MSIWKRSDMFAEYYQNRLGLELHSCQILWYHELRLLFMKCANTAADMGLFLILQSKK